ncbi:hypothetical protein C4E44_14345 [Pseudomonas sp. MWU12-2312b]|nr:hypothetical protein C4E44_14345 [Pseudomonas sp. MWU12-2312b]
MPTENQPVDPGFDLNASDGGRGYIAHLFKIVLKRHDYRHYINERLAGDFACTLAQHFEDIKAREEALQLRLNAADQRVDFLEGLARQFSEIALGGFLDEDHVRRVRRDLEDVLKPAVNERGQGIPSTSFQRLNMLANQGE